MLFFYYLKSQIERTVKNSRVTYNNWHIGLTQRNVEERISEHKKEGDKIHGLTVFPVDTLQEAQDIERYFIHKRGMKGGTGGQLSPNKDTQIYIYWN